VSAEAGQWLAQRATAALGGALNHPPTPAAPVHLCSAFVGDVSIPDNVVVAAGQTFTKTWRLRNCGNTSWSGLTATRIDGIFGPRTFAVPPAAPGEVANVNTTMTAPAGAGMFRATYRLRSSAGVDADNTFWAQIVVPARSAPTKEPPQPTTPAPTADAGRRRTPPPPSPGDEPPLADPGQDPVPAGADELGGVDLNKYCANGWNMYAVLRFQNAWGWRCSTSPVPASGLRAGDQNVDADEACTAQYGSGAKSHYRRYADPNSWFCWRP
jgi:hypothetical protein